MPTTLVARVLERAIIHHRPGPGLLHHSDRGCQYASEAYRDQLAARGGRVGPLGL